MSWVDEVRNMVPGYAKDISLNLDNVINRSSLDEVTAKGVALASAFATGNMDLVNIIKPYLLEEDRQAALTAASLMAMNNVWYPYVEMTGDPALKGLPAQLRMNAYANHGGTTKAKFESYALAASIVGKCHFCVKSHYDTLQKEGLTVEQLRDIGRIAAVVTAVARAMTA
jgi:lipoyl-dependent peroxiredoxin subunit D